MEIFLLSVDENLELSEKIEKIKLDCVMQFRGSPIHKFIHLLVRQLFDPFKKKNYLKLFFRERLVIILMEMEPPL